MTRKRLRRGRAAGGDLRLEVTRLQGRVAALETSLSFVAQLAIAAEGDVNGLAMLVRFLFLRADEPTRSGLRAFAALRRTEGATTDPITAYALRFQEALDRGEQTVAEQVEADAWALADEVMRRMGR